MPESVIANNLNHFSLVSNRCLLCRYSPCYIIGDIHGNIEDLLSMSKTLWPTMPCVGSSFLFLGDYVDRGQWGLECALYLVAFKVLCPNKVTMLRGNHEVSRRVVSSLLYNLY